MEPDLFDGFGQLVQRSLILSAIDKMPM